MAHLIDKDALVAEIERLKTTYNDDENIHHIAKYNILVDILSLIDTLEVKDVDLEKEFDKCCENYIFDDECEVYIARHFFELGLKAKGE